MPAEHFDVVIIGAGLSGIGAAYRLQTDAPARPTPSSKPATPSAAPGTSSATPASAPTQTCSPSATLSARGKKPRPSPTAPPSSTTCAKPRASSASTNTFASTTASSPPHGRPTTPAGTSPHNHDDATLEYTCDFLYGCTGYYRYDSGYAPAFPGVEQFRGQFVHPQHWPDDLDYSGKRVVVIGSGATAVTLVPAMAAPPHTSPCCSARPATSSPCPRAIPSPTSCAAYYPSTPPMAWCAGRTSSSVSVSSNLLAARPTSPSAS